MPLLGWTVRIVLFCCATQTSIKQVILGSATNLKQRWPSNNEELALDNWRTLFFPDDYDLLGKFEDLSSTSEEQSTPVRSGFFQSQFKKKQPGELYLPIKATTKQSVVSRVNREMIGFFGKKLSSIMQTEWQGRKMEDFNLKVLQLNLSVYDVRIVSIEFPQLRFERPSPDVLYLIGSDGKICMEGNYKSIYRTTRHGQIEAVVSGLDIELTLRFRHAEESQLLHLLQMDCKPSIAHIDVKLKPFLLEEVQIAIQQHLWSSLQQQICASVENFVRQTNENFQTLALKTLLD